MDHRSQLERLVMMCKQRQYPTDELRDWLKKKVCLIPGTPIGNAVMHMLEKAVFKRIYHKTVVFDRIVT